MSRVLSSGSGAFPAQERISSPAGGWIFEASAPARRFRRQRALLSRALPKSAPSDDIWPKRSAQLRRAQIQNRQRQHVLLRALLQTSSPRGCQARQRDDEDIVTSGARHLRSTRCCPNTPARRLNQGKMGAKPYVPLVTILGTRAFPTGRALGPEHRQRWHSSEARCEKGAHK